MEHPLGNIEKDLVAVSSSTFTTLNHSAPLTGPLAPEDGGEGTSERPPITPGSSTSKPPEKSTANQRHNERVRICSRISVGKRTSNGIYL